MKAIRQQFNTIDFFLFILLLISQDKDFTYSISAKALTQSLSQAPVLQQMRNQTLST